MACTYADDAYLIARWPQVVVSTPGVWVVDVVAVLAGDYTVQVGGVPYTATATGLESPAELRATLLALLSASLAVTSSPSGVASIVLVQVQQGSLAVAVASPGVGSMTLTQTSGSDNAAQRAIWLDHAKCGLPPCSYFTTCGVSCEGDYTLWHASLAAHLLLVAINTNPSGMSTTSVESMALGPASLKKGKSGYKSPVENDLSSTAPGMIVLMLRRRYLPPFVCA